MISLRHALACILLLPVGPALAQEPASDQAPAIEDNSFLIEEAYNQERGVVQHISTFVHFHGPLRASDYSFTQEWPIGSQRHQFSYTVPYSWPGASPSGVGDVLLNYRYQLFGHDAWAAVAPRLSLILPTAGRALGSGTTGLQVNLPASRWVSRRMVIHANAGATLLPGNGEGSMNLGASAIGLVTRRFNMMLEVTALRGRERDESGASSRKRETIVSPGVRYAINLGALQVVPGLGLPIRFGGDGRTVGAFLYLSFEHPFTK